jgi:Ankyrin repeats (many copies)
LKSPEKSNTRQTINHLNLFKFYMMARKFISLLLFCILATTCMSQCITSPDSIESFEDTTRLRNYCGDINAYDKDGITILMSACLVGTNMELIEDCLKRKPDIFKQKRLDSNFVATEYYTLFNACNYITFPSVADPVESPQQYKGEKEKLEILKLFIRYNPNDSVRICFYAFETLLKYNPFCHNEELFNYVKNRINLNYLDLSGNSYLHTAVRYSRMENANWLCSLGLSLDQKNKLGLTPVDLLKENTQGNKRRKYLKHLRKCSRDGNFNLCED